MPEFTLSLRDLPDRGGQHAVLLSGGERATYADFLDGLCHSPPLRRLLVESLAAAPYDAFRWETPCVSASKLSRPFEFVILDSPGLAPRPEPDVFEQHFARAVDGVVSFENLGGDARLVVPAPAAEDHAYNHLARFVRDAPPAQQDTLFRVVGEQMQQRVTRKSVWLSTAGAGVSWLHVRLDDRPKYYGFERYRAL